MSERFYTPDALSPGEYVLGGAEAHHLAAVCRFAVGDSIVLFNGDGKEYPAQVVSVGRKEAALNLLRVEAISRELSTRIEVASAMPKGDRGDFLIEKLVELGVARFTPLLTERTIVQPKESRLEKLHQAVIEASKQCGRNVLMEIGPLTRWEPFANAEFNGDRFVLHPAGEAANTGPTYVERVQFAIGPEGGFTDREVEFAEKCGWKKRSLGSRILRIETAAVAMAAGVALQ